MNFDNPINPLPSAVPLNDLCLFVFGNRTKSNILFTVNDFDRPVIELSTELDNGPFGTQLTIVSFLKVK